MLGCLLAGIYNQGELADDWIFKGGTCLKKCFFETYRFSEDLDFTLRNPEHLGQDFLAASLGRVAAWVYEQTGLELPADRQDFDLYRNPRGNWSCRAKIPYRGPIGPRGKTSLRHPTPSEPPSPRATFTQHVLRAIPPPPLGAAKDHRHRHDYGDRNSIE